MREDGEITFWQYQMQLSDKTWTIVQGVELRAMHGLDYPKWSEHTACGKVWQSQGECGFSTEKEALEVLPLIKHCFKDKKTTLRVVCITKTQRTALACMFFSR